MANISDMTNAPFEISLGGKKFMARKVSIDAALALVEARVITKELELGQRAAEMLSGMEKIQFLSEYVHSLPKGARLSEMGEDEIGSIGGIKHVVFHALKIDQPDLKESDLDGLVSESNVDEVLGLFNLFTGMTSPKKKRGTRSTRQKPKKKKKKK